MKKAILPLFFLAIASIAANAQKVYATKTGQIKFNASSPIEKIEAVNNQVDSKFVDKTGQIVFSVLIKSFKFDNQLMEIILMKITSKAVRSPKPNSGVLSAISHRSILPKTENTLLRLKVP